MHSASECPGEAAAGCLPPSPLVFLPPSHTGRSSRGPRSLLAPRHTCPFSQPSPLPPTYRAVTGQCLRSTVVVLGHKRHLCDSDLLLLAADGYRELGADLCEWGGHVAHADALLEAGGEAAGGDGADLGTGG
eukprot:scaffold886_cov149-Isochrysis_galbana.AAC.3